MSTPPPSRRPTRPIDWRTWLALAWAIVFGVLYGRMVLDERAPGVLRAIKRAFETDQDTVSMNGAAPWRAGR